jgi:hypothetical protein
MTPIIAAIARGNICMLRLLLRSGAAPNKRKNDGTVRVFRQNFALEDAIGSHACSLQALTCVGPMVFLSEAHVLTVSTINHAETLKDDALCKSLPGKGTWL